jgi:hypothetical protein
MEFPDVAVSQQLAAMYEQARAIADKGFSWREDGVKFFGLCDTIYKMTPEGANPQEFMLHMVLLMNDAFNWTGNLQMLQGFVQLWWTSAGQADLRARGYAGNQKPAGTRG